MLDIWDRLARLPDVAAPRDARAAVLVPLYCDEDDAVRVVLTKRPESMRRHPGDVVFPGGQIERGEDVVTAAKREAWEEVGIPETAVDVIGGLTPVTTRSKTELIVPVVARIVRPEELAPDPTEVETIIEPLVTDLMDEERWRNSEFNGHRLWFFEFDEGILWGATAFMMRELLDHLR